MCASKSFFLAFECISVVGLDLQMSSCFLLSGLSRWITAELEANPALMTLYREFDIMSNIV